MRRFFIDPGQIEGQRAVLTGSEARHLRTVLRAREGMQVELFDGSGAVYCCRIVRVGAERIELQLLDGGVAVVDGAQLTLAVALCKGKTMDFLVQKATELGVARLQPLVTRYSERTPPEERQTQQAARWGRIMMAACKQCRRPLPMEIAPVQELKELELAAFGVSVLLYEGTDGISFQNIRFPSEPAAHCLIIGPEGGFHPEETELLRERGACMVSLGSRILRAETAALSGLAIIQFLLGLLQPEK